MVQHAAADAVSWPTSITEWADMPEDEPGALVDGWIEEEEGSSFVHEAVVVWLIRVLGAWLMGGRFSEDVLAEVLATFRRHLGERMRIDVEFVDDVAMIRTGKRLASVSRLGVDFQKAAPAVIRAPP
jgi:hypothetical protein